MKKLLAFSLLFVCVHANAVTKDVLSIVNQASQSIVAKDPKKIAQLVGGLGADFGFYGTDGPNPGHNNGPRIAKQLQAILAKAKPVCIGYEYNEVDKVLVYFESPGVEWSESSLKNVIADSFVLHFYKRPGSRDRWQLIWITPLTHQDIAAMRNLSPCHEESKKPAK